MATNRLTWRDVAAPNFTGAGEMAGRASNMIQQALGGLMTGADAMEEFRKEQASNFLAQQSATYSSPEALRSALASGELYGNVDPSRFTGRDLNGVNSRINSLLDQDNTRIANTNSQQAGARNQTEFDEKQADRQWAEDNAALINKAKIGSLNGDVTSYAQQLGNINGITPNRLNALLSGNLQMADAANRTATNIFNSNQQARTGLMANNKEDAALVAERWEANAIQQGLVDNTDGQAPNRINAALAGMPDGYVKDAIRTRLSDPTKYPNMFRPQTQSFASPGGVETKASTTSAPGTAGTFTGSSYDVVLGGGKHGNTPVPATQMTAGQWDTFGKNVLIPATRNSKEYGLQDTGKGSSAMGFYQITGETLNEFGKDTFGSDWQNTVMTPENQDKIGKAIFEARKGGDLSKTWAGLPKQAPGFYANKSWDEMKGLINQYESRTTPVSTGPTSDQLRDGIELNRINDNVATAGGGGDMAMRLLTASERNQAGQAAGTNSIANVTAAATAKDGPLEGMDKNRLGELIRKVQARIKNNISPEGAMEFLKDSQYSRRDTVWGVPNILSGKRVADIDEDALDKLLDSYKGDKYQKSMQDAAIARQQRASSNRNIDEWAKIRGNAAAVAQTAASLPANRAAPLINAATANLATTAEGLNTSFGVSRNLQAASGTPFGSPAAAPVAAPPTPAVVAPPAPIAVGPSPALDVTDPAAMRARMLDRNKAREVSAQNAREATEGKIQEEMAKIERLKTARISEGTRDSEIRRVEARIRKLREDI